MSITFTLIDRTPLRLRYKCYYNNEAPALGTLPNDGGVTPDLRTDITAVNNPGAGGSPLFALIRANQDGLGSIVTAGAMTQAQARAFFLGDDNAGAVLISDLVPRAMTTITAMTVAKAWACDWGVDAQNDPVCLVRAATGSAGYATLDIHFRHSKDL